MTWFRVDDTFHSHPKSTACSLAALGLWAAAGSWSGSHLTDGFVPEHQVPLLARGQSELAAELVRAGLWKRARGGYRFHDWLDRNPSAEEVKSVRQKRAEAGRAGGLASGKTRSKRQANASANASRGLEPPSRPDPPPSKGRGSGGRGDLRVVPKWCGYCHKDTRMFVTESDEYVPCLKCHPNAEAV
jgi:hypothetical protein